MLLHADNFNYYGVDETLLLDGVYASSFGISIEDDPDGLTTEKCLLFAFTGGETGIRWVLPAANAVVGVARRVWLAAIPSSDDARPAIIQWRDGGNNRIASVCVTPTGALEFRSDNTVVATTTGPVLTAGGWYHVEAKLTCDIAGAAEVEVRVEGVTVLTHDSFSTTDATVSQIACGASSGASGATNNYVKDLVVWDGSGTSNNDFLGSVLVYELIPTSDNTMGGWTSTGANGFGVLDNNPPEDGVAYISADDTPPAAAQFGLSDLPLDVTSVKGLISRVRASKSDGGDGQLQVSLVSGASTDNGADRAITAADTYWSDVSELDPATAAAWTPVAVNAALLKLDRTV